MISAIIAPNLLYRHPNLQNFGISRQKFDGSVDFCVLKSPALLKKQQPTEIQHWSLPEQVSERIFFLFKKMVKNIDNYC